MTTFEELDGLEIVGYRYGEAPENGKSFNTRERIYEPGVSMAKVGHNKEIRSFAVDGQTSKKYYYVGLICGETGSDDEICLRNVRRITVKEYRELLNKEEYINVSNKIVDAYADRKVALANKGFYGYSIDDAENYRNTYKKG